MAPGTCVTHGTKQPGAVGWTLYPQAGRLRACPHERTREVAVKKIVIWLVVAFMVFYVIQAPEQSAQFVRSAGEALGDAATSLAAFVESLV